MVKVIGNMSIVEKARTFAAVAHKGQLDDGGNDYFISHCAQVYEIIRILYPYDYNLQAAAYLHDTVEDTATTYEILVKEFGHDIADLVMEVTHERNQKDTKWYFPRLKSVRGYVLKFADRDSNLSRMEGAWDEDRIKKYLERSRFFDIEDR